MRASFTYQIKVRVIEVDKRNKRVELSAKASVVKNKPLLTINDLRKGMKLKGYVRRIEAYGIFIDIKDSKRLTGLCHSSEVQDDAPKKSKRKVCYGITWQSSRLYVGYYHQ